MKLSIIAVGNQRAIPIKGRNRPYYWVAVVSNRGNTHIVPTEWSPVIVFYLQDVPMERTMGILDW